MWQMKTSPKRLELFLFDTIDGWEDSETSANTVRKMLTDDIEQIDVHINSIGGNVMEGVAIYNLLRRHKANVTVYVDGFACSIASVIAMSGDRVIMPKNAMMMIHNCWTVAIGNATELRKTAEALDKIMEGGRYAYLSKAGDKLTEEKLMELLEAETYLTSTECYELGLCDEVEEREVNLSISPPNDPAKQRVAAQLLKIVPGINQSKPGTPDDIKQPEKPATKTAPTSALNFLAALCEAAKGESK